MGDGTGTGLFSTSAASTLPNTRLHPPASYSTPIVSKLGPIICAVEYPDRLSISYARDFDLAAESGPAVADDGPADMTNVDGMFATQARRQPPRT